jgi:hypothetical protein
MCKSVLEAKYGHLHIRVGMNKWSTERHNGLFVCNSLWFQIGPLFLNYLELWFLADEHVQTPDIAYSLFLWTQNEPLDYIKHNGMQMQRMKVPQLKK